MNDIDLHSLADGDERAFKALFDQYYKRLASLAYQYQKDADHARDTVQNVFVKLFQRREEFASVRDTKAYLYRIVQNECLNEIRNNETRRRHYLNYAVHTESVFEAHVGQSEKEYRLYQAIKSLPPRCRQIFVMSRIEGKKNSEIADDLKLSVRTVETQISIALKSLRTSLLSALALLNIF